MLEPPSFYYIYQVVNKYAKFDHEYLELDSAVGGNMARTPLIIQRFQVGDGAKSERNL